MAGGPGNPWAGSGLGNIRAADADRDRVAAILAASYTEGRLSKDEYDARLETALSARTYADLDQLVADLPGPGPLAPTRPSAVTQEPRTNSLAIASLLFGVGQLAIGPLATIPAIVLGHMARGQIRRTGEGGAGLALAGLVLGWGAVILGIILIAGLAVVASTHPLMNPPMQGP